MIVIYVIYDLWPTYSFLLPFLIAPLNMVTLTTSQIYLLVYLIYLRNKETQQTLRVIVNIQYDASF